MKNNSGMTRCELMIKSLLLFAILVAALMTFLSCQETSKTSTASPGPELQFESRFTSTGGSGVNAMVTDALGNVYLAGYSGSVVGQSMDYTIIKYDNKGNQLWSASFNKPGKGGWAESIAVDESGNVYATGQVLGMGTSGDYITVKYDSSGNQIWAAEYNGTGNGDDGALVLAIDNTGVYVTGSSLGKDSGQDFVTIKYDLNGNEIWQAAYNSPENSDDIPQSMAIDDTGNVYVTGVANSLHGLQGGSSYVPLPTIPGTGKGYFTTLKYDKDGRQLWVETYKGTGNNDDIARVIKLDSSGNVYVTGESPKAGEHGDNYDFVTIKYDPFGKQLWLARYDGGNGNDGAFAMVLDKSGNIVVTGYSDGSQAREYATVKYNEKGDQLWAARYKGPYGDSIAYSIAADGSDNVYITGMSGFIKYDSTAYENYATLKYDKDGNQLWVVRYGDGQESNNIAGLLALDPSGSVLVTGITYQKGVQNSDITTIKYTQK